jgi:hypothetical protein
LLTKVPLLSVGARVEDCLLVFALGTFIFKAQSSSERSLCLCSRVGKIPHVVKIYSRVHFVISEKQLNSNLHTTIHVSK